MPFFRLLEEVGQAEFITWGSTGENLDAGTAVGLF